MKTSGKKITATKADRKTALNLIANANPEAFKGALSFNRKDALKSLVKLAIFSFGSSIAEMKHSWLDIGGRSLIFTTSLILNRTCIAGKTTIRIIPDDELNDALQQCVFSIAFQILMETLFIRDEKKILIDSVSIAAVFAIVEALEYATQNSETQSD